MPSSRYTVNLPNVHLKSDGTPQDFLLPISVGQEYHTDGKFKATIKAILEAIINNKDKDNKIVSHCTILVGDTLQRHRLQIEGETKEGAEEKAADNGKNWVAESKELIKQVAYDLKLNLPGELTKIGWDNNNLQEFLDKIFTFNYWDQWLKDAYFKDQHNMVIQKYNENLSNEYRGGIDAAKYGFVGMYSNNHIKVKAKKDKTKFIANFNGDHALQLSQTYIYEELAVLSLYEKSLPTERETIFVYPFNNNSVSEGVVTALKCLLRESSPLKFSDIIFETKTKTKNSPKKGASAQSRSVEINSNSSAIKKFLFHSESPKNDFLSTSPSSISSDTALTSSESDAEHDNSPKSSDDELDEILDRQFNNNSRTKTEDSVIKRLSENIMSSSVRQRRLRNYAKIAYSSSISCDKIVDFIVSNLLIDHINEIQLKNLARFTIECERVYDQQFDKSINDVLDMINLNNKQSSSLGIFIKAYDDAKKLIQSYRGDNNILSVNSQITFFPQKNDNSFETHNKSKFCFIL